MIIYGLKNCDNCRKAAKALQGATLRDVRAEPLDLADLQRFYDAFGADLVNQRSTTWRNLSDAERALPQMQLLHEHPSLMKRPVIDANGTLHLGWGEKTRQALL